MKIGVRTKPIRTWRWAGRGRLTRRSSGPSRWRRISAARGRAWPFPGPAISRMSGGIRTQFHHVIDIVPTLLEATGIKAPELVNGIPQKPIEGVSMAYTFDQGQRTECAVETRDAVFRDGRQPRDLSRRLGGCHDAALRALAPGSHDASAGRLQMGTLQRRQGLFREQRPRGAAAGQTEGNAGVVPDRGGKIPGLPLGQLRLCARARAQAERDRRENRIHLHGCECRHSLRQCARASWTRTTPSPPR